jgi:hypothetical protein
MVMRILWLTIDRSARAMQIHDPLREAVEQLADVTTIKRQVPNPVAKAVRRIMSEEDPAPEQVASVEFLQSFDFIYTDAHFVYTSEMWSHVAQVPKATMMCDQHGRLVEWYIREALRWGFRVFTTYRSALETYWPELVGSAYWLPVWFDPAVFHAWDVPKKPMALMTGVLEPTVYQCRTAAHNLLQGQSFYQQVNRPPETAEGKDGPRGREYAEMLASATLSFVCASCHGYVVTKYVEIPACGTCLVAETTPDLEAMGFRPFVHYIPLEPGKNLANEIQHWVTSDNEGVEDIAVAGHELVHERHTATKRADLFMECAERVVNTW